MLCTTAINTSNTIRTQTGAAERWSSGLDSNSCCYVITIRKCFQLRSIARVCLQRLILTCSSMEYSDIAVRNVTLPHSYGNSHAICDHTVSPATRQRRHSRLYSTRSWYSIQRPGGIQDWIDLGAAVKVRIPYPRLHITVAFAINTTVRGEIRTSVLSHLSRAR